MNPAREREVTRLQVSLTARLVRIKVMGGQVVLAFEAIWIFQTVSLVETK